MDTVPAALPPSIATVPVDPAAWEVRRTIADWMEMPTIDTVLAEGPEGGWGLSDEGLGFLYDAMFDPVVTLSPGDLEVVFPTVRFRWELGNHRLRDWFHVD